MIVPLRLAAAGALLRPRATSTASAPDTTFTLSGDGGRGCTMMALRPVSWDLGPVVTQYASTATATSAYDCRNCTAVQLQLVPSGHGRRQQAVVAVAATTTTASGVTTVTELVCSATGTTAAATA
ncbi:hypothetical protein GGR56DRAFT_203401 [Xylariaceae sp. FL0804]|nr:hypothetical protein GGR56DRAFT_203401 [Xylariaceae sp. FL0804]